MTETHLFVIIIAIFWLSWGARLTENFETEIKELPTWRSLVLQAVLIFGAGFFCIEEVLEILIDEIIGNEEE